MVKFLALKIGNRLMNSFSRRLGNVPPERNKHQASFRLGSKPLKIVVVGKADSIKKERISSALGDLKFLFNTVRNSGF